MKHTQTKTSTAELLGQAEELADLIRATTGPDRLALRRRLHEVQRELRVRREASTRWAF